MSRPLATIGHALAFCLLTGPPAIAQTPPRRPVTVRDMVEMSRIAGHDAYTTGVHRPGIFSSTGDRLVFVVERGDLTRNAIHASLLLFRTDQLLRAPRPDTILTRTTTTNHPAIGAVQWIPGDSALAFLAEDDRGVAQVHQLHLASRTVRQLTRSDVPIESYTFTPGGERLLTYAAGLRLDSALVRERRGRGFVVEQSDLRPLLRGDWGHPRGGEHVEMAVTTLATGQSATITMGELEGCTGVPQLAVTGRYAVSRCTLPAIPAHWREHENNAIRGFAVAPVLALLDLERGVAEPLLDVPWHRAEVSWTPDGHAILVRNTLLPRTGVDAAEREARLNLRSTVLIDPASRAVTILARRDSLALEGWDAAGTALVLRSTGGAGATLGFRREGQGWRPVPASSVRLASARAGPPEGLDVRIDEDLNTPPRVVAVTADGRRSLLFEPNPQFGGLAFGRMEHLRWQTRDGEWDGGLYYPVGYTPGRRYPLVIQTHGFSPDRFQIEGYAYTGYAGQALAGQGIVVLQVGDGPRAAARRALTTPEEGPFNQRGLEAAIDTLADRGLIDRNRVGLQGWSRTTFHVRYMLSHSAYPIAAALISDGVDFSYFRYLIDNDLFRSSGESIGGGIPIGDTFRTWQERIPTLAADRFKAPVRIEAIAWPGGGGPLTQWELFALLRRLGKPVEMAYYPDGAHNLLKPGERLTSQGGAVDWFRFWLQGEEDPDPAKAGQYARWRRMRQAAPAVP